MSEALPILANIHLDFALSNILKQYELKLITCEECREAILKISIVQEEINT